MSSPAPSLTSDSSSSSTPLPSPLSPLFPRLPQLFAELTFFLVPAHLPPETDERITALGGERVGDARAARIVITALRGRPRLERILGPGATAMPNLLSDAFVADTYALAAAHGRDAVSLALPDRERYRVFKPSASAETVHEKPDAPASPTSPASPTTAKPDITEYPPDIPLRSIPRMAVARPCPLTCANQDILDAIRPIYALREFEEGAQKNSNILSYRRSMSILKSVPRRLRSGAEARKLVDVGEKVAKRIDEYLSTGEIAESAAILESAHYRALVEFSSIHGVGHATAAELWERGCRTLDDVHHYYCDGDGKEEEPQGSSKGSRKRKRESGDEHRAARHALRRRMEGTMTRAEVVCAWLDLKDDLAAPIPRSEAEEIAAVVAQNAEALHPGCVWTIAGGGKPEVSDVDVILSPPTEDPGLLHALCRRLGRLGIVTHVLQKTVRDPHTPLHSSGANFDNLDKAFVILRLPADSGGSGNKASGKHGGPRSPRLHRRVDIILAPRERYAAAVLSWSGSMMFERDLRRVAEDQYVVVRSSLTERGYKFRAGLLSRTNEEIHFGSEREILAFLGLAYVPPELRNADG